MFSRRHILQGIGAAGLSTLAHPRLVRAAGDGPRFVVVVGCFGGASMLDCMMPIDTTEAFSSGRGTVISHPTIFPKGSNIRCVDRDVPVSFLAKYADSTVVLGSQSSSVNHFTAAHRAVSGRGTDRGRTLSEAIAAVYGTAMPIPNVNMGRGGYAEPGTDPTLDARYAAEIVTNPITFPLSTSGWHGVLPSGDLPAQDPETLARLVDHTRALRDGTLEQLSPFGQTFAGSRLRQELLYGRATTAPELELADLIQELLFVPDLGEAFPINRYGLSASAETNLIQSILPDSFPGDTSGTAKDRLQAQAALAYLLLRSGTSCAVTLTDPGTDGFLAFDQSHQNHADAQATHWDRALDVVDRLIQLLSQAEYAGTGQSLWDRTLIVFATEFGRDKWDTGGSFGTGHHLNNGTLMVSPMLNGNQALGVPDPANGFICGYDTQTGDPTPFDDIPPGEDPLFTDARLPPGEAVIYGTALAALGITYEGQEIIDAVL